MCVGECVYNKCVCMGEYVYVSMCTNSVKVCVSVCVCVCVSEIERVWVCVWVSVCE